LGGGLTLGGGKASGGRVLAGTTYIGGEHRGRELFTPAVDGFVTPNSALAGMEGGMMVHQTIHNHFDHGMEAVDARIRRAAPDIQKAAADGIRNANQRTGGMAMR
jgi:hypothetical protein